MAEAKIVTFDHRELAAILIKHQDIHEGLWSVYFEFQLAAANVPIAPDSKNFIPASINFVVKVGIQRAPSHDNLCVDAAVVNPLKSKPAKKRMRR